MPTYQYACTNAGCGNRFELVQSFTDPAARECPVCESPVRKVYGSVGVVFKGSGFYRTDSRAGNGKVESGAGASSGSDSSKQSAAGSSADSTSGGSSDSSSGSPASTPSSGTSGKSGSAGTKSTGSGSGSGKVAASA
jgi:putative FmdB family regulatory protein